MLLPDGRGDVWRWGCTIPEIAAVTGHSPRDVEAILEAHDLGAKVELAERVIANLDARYGSRT